MDGFSGEQQFFLSFAQGWRAKAREAALRQQIVTDGHAPDEYRVGTGTEPRRVVRGVSASSLASALVSRTRRSRARLVNGRSM
jgi:Peptidase family M13